MTLAIFEDRVWQMSLGERAAVEGVLSAMEPRLAIEIGSMEGASLRRIAAHAAEVHSFDLNPPSLEQSPNVTLHTGDSHELLPRFLAQLAKEGRNVDFVMVDGDHSAEGVRRDLEDLLDSPALSRSVILIHDTANGEVRRGLDSTPFAAWPKVTYVDLDWIAGKLYAEPALRNELWSGLGLVLLDGAQPAYGSVPYEQRYHPTAPLLALIQRLVYSQEAGQTLEQGLHQRVTELERTLGAVYDRNAALEAEMGVLREDLERARHAIADITESASWRLTEPLRNAKRKLKAD